MGPIPPVVLMGELLKRSCDLRKPPGEPKVIPSQAKKASHLMGDCGWRYLGDHIQEGGVTADTFCCYHMPEEWDL